MKRVLFPILSLFFVIAFTCSVKATTYQVEALLDNNIPLHLREVIHFEPGDVIEFNSGTFPNTLPDRYYINITMFTGYSETGHFNMRNYEQVTLSVGESWIVPRDLYGTGNTYYYTMRSHITHSEVIGDGIERVYASCEGGTPPYTYVWLLSDERTIIQDVVNTDVPYIDVNYHDIQTINVVCLDSSDLGGGSCFISQPDPDVYTLRGNSASNNESDNTVGNDSTADPKKQDTPQTPSTVPSGTAQISIGANDKTFANIKVLNQFPHDSVNQKIIADLYAANQKKRTDVIMQKNVFPPYGVKNDWKSTSHTVRWNNLNVKKGDNIIIVWYTPAFWGHGSTLKVIPATVVADGTIEFTIPSMGDMSVMSIVKLK